MKESEEYEVISNFCGFVGLVICCVAGFIALPFVLL